MRYVLRLPNESTAILRKMADEAGVGVVDIIEISVYNLVACYLKEHGSKEYEVPAEVVLESDDAHDDHSNDFKFSSPKIIDI